MTRRRTEPTRDTDLHQPQHLARRRDADGRAHGGENGDYQSFYGVWRSNSSDESNRIPAHLAEERRANARNGGASESAASGGQRASPRRAVD